MRAALHEWLANHLKNEPEGQADAQFLGLNPNAPFEVHSARFASRASPDGDVARQLLVGLLQETTQPVDPKDPKGPKMKFEGGCTIIADLRTLRLRYCIRKSLESPSRIASQQEFAMREFDGPRATYLGVRALSPDVPGAAESFAREPFAMIHRGL